MTVICLIRHAQASFGAANYDALSPLGREQAAKIGETLRAREFLPDAVFSGGLTRHRDTASILAERLDVALEETPVAGLEEYDFMAVLAAHDPRLSDLNGVRKALAAGRDLEQILRAAIADWIAAPEGAAYPESFDAFRTRVDAAMAALARRAVADGLNRVAVVTSGGPIAATALSLLSAPSGRFFDVAWRLANGGLTTLVAQRGALHLVTYNDFSFLDGPERRLLTFR